MRVLFITSSYPASEQDPRGTFIHVLARSLVEQGVEVTVLAPGAPGAPTTEQRDGVEIHRATYWIPRWQRLASGLSGIAPNMKSMPWLVIQLPSMIVTMAWHACRLAASADLIHAHWVYPGGLIARIAGLSTLKPMIVTSHGGDLNLARRVKVLRRVAKGVVSRAAHCVAVNRELVDDFVSLGAAPQAVSQIACGVRAQAIDVAHSTKKDVRLEEFQSGPGLRIVYVGSLIPRKSVGTLIDATTIAGRSGVSLTCAIVGTGPEYDALRHQAEHAASGNVMLVGERSPGEVPRWMAAADVLVLPSLSEGRPLALLEAMAMRRAVVATDVPGTRELVQHGRNGLLFPPGDADRLAAHLERLARQPAEARLMGQRGTEVVGEQQLWASDVARRHLNLYEDVLQARKVGASSRLVPT